MPQKRNKKNPNQQSSAAMHHAKWLVHHVHKHVKPHALRAKHWWLRRSFWQKLGLWCLAILMLMVSSMYGVARWYIAKHSHEPLQIGVTFIPDYARYFDLDPQDTMQAMISDLGMRRFRLVSYWEDGEPEPGKYNFTDLDWEFKKVEQAGGTVSLAIGLRQPRWPECHWPNWAQKLSKKEWQAALNNYMRVVIERYKGRAVLQSYQLENEYFLKVFGQCTDFSRERLTNEFNYVRSLDPTRPIIVTRSNNAVPSWPVGQPRADINGASIYKRVWDRTVTKRYFEYPLPAWFYAFLAGGAELTTGRNTMIHEMQVEAWPPDGIKDSTIAEQDKSMPASQIKNRINYGIATGMRTIDLWGVEWWYWRKIELNDPSLWDAGKQAIQEAATANKQCSNTAASTAGDGYSSTPC